MTLDLLFAIVLILFLGPILLFMPLKRWNPRRIPVVRSKGLVPHSIENTGGVPWLRVNGMPYPGSFDNSDRRQSSLNGEWGVRKDSKNRGRRERWFEKELEWDPIRVPKTYNAALDEETEWLGVLWYRKVFPDPRGPGKLVSTTKIRLCFEGILLRGEVWMNGRPLGTFEGGYTPVYYDVTDHLEGNNSLVVRCDNTLTWNSLPPKLLRGHNPGWHTYAGIYRSVYLEEIPARSIVKAHVRLLEGGLVDTHWLTWNHDNDAPEVWKYYRLNVMLTFPDSRLLGTAVSAEFQSGPWGTALWHAVFRLDAVHLWDPKSQQKYKFQAELSEPGSIPEDSVDLKVGLRTIDVVSDALLHNGRPLFLKGIGRHEDHPLHGATQPDARIQDDLKLIREMGANYVRLAHYPHCREELNHAEESGLFLSEEIPLYQAGLGFAAWYQEKRGPARFPAMAFGLRQVASRKLLTNARRQLIEMIERDRHRPSILFWSLGNECYTLGRRGGRVFDWLRAIAKSFDPERPVTVVEPTYGMLGLDRFKRGWEGADILSVNSYYGWYFGETTNLADYLDAIRRRWPDKPLILSEFGAGAAPGRRESDGYWRGERITTRRTYSEDYQEELIRTYWETARERPWITGFSPWVFSDFYNTWFPNNPVPNYNLKGIVSKERVPKKSWYALRELYREDEI